MPKTIGLIFAWNSASTLEDTFNRIPQSAVDEVILANDGSTDDTLAVAERLGIPAFTHEHGGYGANVKFGLKKALERGADVIIEIHADGQYEIEKIPKALQKIRAGCDFLLGSRFTSRNRAREDGMSLVRYLANKGLSFLDRLLLGLDLSEFHTGFRVYTRKLLETVPFEAGGDTHLFSFEIIVQAKYFGLNVCEIPVRCDYLKEHSSIELWRSTVYAFQTFWVIALFRLAQLGLNTKLFRK